MTTFFLIMRDGRVIRKTAHHDVQFWGSIGMRLAADAEQIIELWRHGRGKTIKNRFSEEPQYFTEEEMVMIALQAESV